MKLMKYLNKKVKITDKDGFIWIGIVTEYTPAIDNDENVESIDVVVEKNNKFNTKCCYEFTEIEISQIEVIK